MSDSLVRSEVPPSDLVSLPAHVAVLVSRLRHVALPPALHAPAERVWSLAPGLDANTLASRQAMVARRAALAEVRAAASAVDATLEALAIATLASGLTRLRQPFGPAGGTVSQLRRLRPMAKVPAVQSLLALLHDHGGDALDAAMARTGAALTRLVNALDASALASNDQERATRARDEVLEQVGTAIQRLRRHAAVALEDQPDILASLFAGLPVERRRRRRRKPEATTDVVSGNTVTADASSRTKAKTAAPS